MWRRVKILERMEVHVPVGVAGNQGDTHFVNLTKDNESMVDSADGSTM
jgi:hypothetical protein